MDIRDFQKKNLERCEESFFYIQEWSKTDWACALAGEVGELCNFIKKERRGDVVDNQDIANEIADVYTYLDLLASRCGLDLNTILINKFNAVSKKRGSHVILNND